MQLNFARYLALFGVSLLGVLLLAWVYVALAPMAFMESGYAAWAAKSAMLRECQLGQVAFFGDSRLEAGVIPAALPVEASNFGLAAGTAIEARSAIRRALQCPALPRQAVITLVPEHFGPLSKFFWVLSLRYGFLSASELWATENLADRLDDRLTFSTATPDGLHGRVRDWLYALRFPALSFGSLVQGRIAGRDAGNRARYREILQARGWAEYGPGGDGPPGQPLDRFVVAKVQTADFEAAIAALRDRGVEVVLLIMPFAVSHHERAPVVAAYLDYLADVARRYPGVRLVTDSVPIWPDRLFADGGHLDGEGARLFSARLATCFADGVLHPGCDLAWRGAPETAARPGSAVLEVQQERDRQH